MASRFFQSCEELSRWATTICGAALVVSVLLVAFEVIIRKAFGVSTAMADEVSGYIFAGATAWSLSFALYRRRHIRIDALYIHFPPTVQRALDLAALISMLAFFSILAYQSVFVFLESVRIGAAANTVLRTPLWIPQLVWMLGLVFFAFTIAVVLAETLAALFRRDFALVKKIAAAPSINEEIAEELADTDMAVGAAGGGGKGRS